MIKVGFDPHLIATPVVFFLFSVFCFFFQRIKKEGNVPLVIVIYENNSEFDHNWLRRDSQEQANDEFSWKGK